MLLEERDYGVRLTDLPPGVKGFVKHDADYDTVILNSRHTWEGNRETFKHEYDHADGTDYEQEDVDAVEAKAHERRHYG